MNNPIDEAQVNLLSSQLGVKRTDQILGVAGELFLAHGYEGVSLGMVVAKTGGSFRDLYREFGSKEKLFVRVMTELCNEVIASLHSASEVRASKHLPPLEDVLTSVGSNVLQTLLSPRLLELHRLILNVAKRFPALGERWYETGPNSANRAVAAVLRPYSEAGLLETEDPCLLAALFLDSLINNLQLRMLVGMTVSQDEMDRRVHVCVPIFLNGIRERRRNRPSPANGE